MLCDGFAALVTIAVGVFVLAFGAFGLCNRFAAFVAFAVGVFVNAFGTSCGRLLGAGG